MRIDLRPYWVKKAYLRFRDAYIDYFFVHGAARSAPTRTS